MKNSKEEPRAGIAKILELVNCLYDQLNKKVGRKIILIDSQSLCKHDQQMSLLLPSVDNGNYSNLRVKAVIFIFLRSSIDFLVAQTVKHLPTIWEAWVQSVCQEDPLEKGMATHSSTLAWKIPWMEEPGRL